MRWIEKKSPPHCLAERKRALKQTTRDSGQPARNSDWDPLDCAQPLREALWQQQGGLCAYCMQHISPETPLDEPAPSGNGGTRIEHFEPREKAPDRMYDWDNLLGVCGGYFAVPGQDVVQHCDRAKGSETLMLNPLRRTPDPDQIFKYRRDDGRSVLLIESDHPDGAAAIELLGLNASNLARARRDAEIALSRKLARDVRKPIAQVLRRALTLATSPDARGQLPAFAPVVERYIRHRASRANAVLP